MGCSSSKDAVKSIQVQENEVRSTSAKKIKVKSTKESIINESDATYVGITKSTSAKSRDSGIQEMDYERTGFIEGIITEGSDPNLIEDVEGQERPKTPEFELVGRQFQSKSAGRERVRSKAILDELEAEGIITGSKVEKGGAAFEVRMGPLQPLEPLAPIRKPPPRLQRLMSEKRLLTKDELDEKLKLAETRRNKNLQKKKSRLAAQLERDQELAQNMRADGDSEFPEDGTSIAEHHTSNEVEFKQKENKEEMNHHFVQKTTVFDEESMSSMDDGLNDSYKVDSGDSNDNFFSST